jgi:hypothetical protein
MRLLIPCLALLAIACSAEPVRNAATNEGAPVESGGPVAPVAPANVATPLPPENQAEPEDAKSPQAAAAVLRRYFALAAAGRDADAARLWGDADGATVFAARLRGFGDFRPNVAAPGRVEGAAGSLYVDIALQLLRDGRSLADGTAVMRRVNDVPGSTAEQRRWHIDRITLQPSPQPIAYRFVGRWAPNERNCADRAWRFTAHRLTTPAGAVCDFQSVRAVPGGFDIAARCTAEGPPADDTLQLRFAESARALLFESHTIADAGLVRCP